MGNVVNTYGYSGYDFIQEMQVLHTARKIFLKKMQCHANVTGSTLAVVSVCGVHCPPKGKKRLAFRRVESVSSGLL